MNTSQEFNVDTLDTGDILLFKGITWYDKLIESFGRSPYSHIVIVLKDPVYIHSDLHGYYILESGFEQCEDIEGKMPFGVQITKLTDVIHTSPGCELYVRHLETIRDQHFYNTIAKIYNDHKNDPYDTSITDWIEAKFIIDSNSPTVIERLFFWNNVQKTRSFYCSALAAFVYCRLGLLEMPNSVPWSVIAPYEWSMNGGTILQFKDCRLGPEKQLRERLVVH